MSVFISTSVVYIFTLNTWTKRSLNKLRAIFLVFVPVTFFSIIVSYVDMYCITEKK